MSAATLKALHIFAVTLFVGNIIVSAFWKALADRTRDVGIIRYATRLVNLTDVFFTAGGIALLMATGHAMAPFYGGVMATSWIRWSYFMVIGSGLIWLFVLLPVQIAQSRLLRPLASQAEIPARYWKLSMLWTVAGIPATLLPLPAIYLMAVKPAG
ncbi:DUF2269 family protein [Noviherbaspirillum cavernae]|uniref:DUF2269 family protein n=1 Tax=Noviherbaspirillum cavernae TaxID=2320862 RepID=A0A418X6H6_9BURK|nr:DUF2269 family protein [Noviherbaspirillum cavernae]RJG08060.1 DUF2269 family protein [Noviherbaspirillum cavernae]